MKKSVIGEIKTILENRKKEILEGSAESLNGDLNKEADKSPDPSDLATSESDQSFSIRLRERERKLLAKIEEALERIKEGTYGICDSCGEEIKEQRLRARPVTTLCIHCKTEQEEMERRQRF